MIFAKYAGVLVLGLAVLAGCGGGGGGGSTGGGGGVPTNPPTSTPTATPPPVTVTGTLASLDTGLPLVGATVTVGAMPNSGSGAASLGSPVAPTFIATTDASGNFTVVGVPIGSMMLQASLSGYATLHIKMTVASGFNSIGTKKITQLTPADVDELQRTNSNRTANGATSNIVVDEYATEVARAWASYEAQSGDYGDSPTQFARWQTMYQAFGAAYLLGSNVAAPGNPTSWATADGQFMAEKANCPPGAPASCVPGPTTGHYLNIVSAREIWIGLGTATGKAPVGFTGTFDYYVQAWVYQ